MSDESNKIDVDEVVMNLFRELVGERAERLAGAFYNEVAQRAMQEAIKEEFPAKSAHDIAFHLADWNNDAAFIVAVLLFPERFTKEQISSGIEGFLIHAPNHVAAAAKLAGWPVEDSFNVGALDGAEEP